MKKTLSFILSLTIAFALIPVTASSSDTIVTNNIIELKEYVSPEGFVHPGIGSSAETLTLMRNGILAGSNPWADYFEGLRRTGYVSLNASLRLTTRITNDGEISQFRQDAETAWSQAIMYIITGNEEYRKIPVKIFKHYASVSPEEFFPANFTDCNIKIGKYVYTMCSAAEIMRYTGSDVPKDLTDALAHNTIKPIVDKSIGYNGYFMNQHTYAIIGVMAYYILIDDVDGYNKTVEWTTVNKTAVNQGRNGSIKGVVREVIRNDKTGENVNPTIQVVEMGRDMGHAEGNLYNLIMMCRTMDIQHTLIDEKSGEVSETGIPPVRFLDDRLLKGYSLYIKYNIGFDIDWIPTYSETGEVKAIYNTVSSAGRRSFSTCGIPSAYYMFRGMGFDDSDNYMNCISAVYHNIAHGFVWGAKSSHYITNVHNYAFDFWTGIKPSAAEIVPDKERAEQILGINLGDANYIDALQFENISIDMSQLASSGDRFPGSINDIPIERFDNFIRLKTTQDPRTLLISTSVSGKMGFLMRSDKDIRIDLRYESDMSTPPFATAYLSGTKGQLKFVPFEFNLGGRLYITIIGDNAAVDFDCISTNSGEFKFIKNNTDYNRSIITYLGNTVTIDCSAQCDGAITYTADNIKINGIIEFTPDQIGDTEIFVTAECGNTVLKRKIIIYVAEDIDSAKEYASAAYDRNAEYEAESLSKIHSALSSGNLELIRSTAESMKLINPKLPDGSLDYRGICTGYSDWVLWNTADDDPNTFGRIWGSERSVTMDFGKDYRIEANAFAIQPRGGFPKRINTAAFYGSDDGVNWIKLTDDAVTNEDLQVLDVFDRYKGRGFRHIAVARGADYNDVGCLDLGTIRIYGNRILSDGNNIHGALMECDDINYFHPDGKVTRGEAAQMLAKTIPGFVRSDYRICEFNDVNESNQYYGAITYLSERGIIPAESKTFRSDEYITRGEIAYMVSRLLNAGTSHEKHYCDTEDSVYNALFEKNIMIGFGDGTFRADNNLTRAEMAALLCKISNRICDGGYENPFVDIDYNHWAYYEILETATKHNIVE